MSGISIRQQFPISVDSSLTLIIPQKSSWMGRVCSIGVKCLTYSLLVPSTSSNPVGEGLFRHSCEEESNDFFQRAQSKPFYAKWLNDEQLAEAIEFEALYHEKALASSSNYSQYISELHKYGNTQSELMSCPSTQYAPKPLPLDGALRLDSEIFNMMIREETLPTNLSKKVREKPSMKSASQKAKEIIQSWYPDNYEIHIGDIFLRRGFRTDSTHLLHYSLHTDYQNIASLSIPESEYPIRNDGVWLSQKGEVLLTYGMDSESRVQTRNEAGDLISYHLDELKGPVCHSKLTTPILPGLMKNRQGVTENGLEETGFLEKQDCGAECQQQMSIQLQNNLMSIPYSETPYLFYGVGLVHAPASRENEPNFEHPLCSDPNAPDDRFIERMLLSFTYSVEIAEPTCSKDEEDAL